MRNPFGQRGWSGLSPLIGIIPASLLFLVFGIIPSIMTAYYSLTQYSGLPGTPITFIGFQNYRMAFTGGFTQIGQAIKVTIIFALAVTFIQNAAGLAMALALNKRVRGVAVYRAVVFLPQVLSVVVIGLIWTLIFSPNGGPMEPIWKAVFGHSSSFLGSYSLALPIIIFVQIWSFTGFTMLVYLAGLQTIPKELYESAKIDGAGAWKSLKYITWPMLAPSATVNIFLAVLGSIGEYSLTYVLTDGNYNTSNLGMYMFNTAFGGSSQLGYGSMLTMLQFGMTLIVGLLLQWYLRRREIQL